MRPSRQVLCGQCQYRYQNNTKERQADEDDFEVSKTNPFLTSIDTTKIQLTRTGDSNPLMKRNETK